ncbi:HNH endonuclease family protein [Actinacidiphila sp. ITFR-21]|uniref:HNH endonuclease family protein n=1 Tax=Actinacidiphila sp. ITFR-21 TaxID=3075199 RepID=UPI00288C1790|nr:HNH endonuclease family protein [Streptomyces sp. ITFR-21]WNI19189.1 HNH endonuclease family protein [Streptomyces sp. ITFR-21]
MRRTMLALLTAVTVLVTIPAAAGAQEPAAGPVSVRALIERLPVAAEDRTGYERAKFRHWVDADRDGCSTRAEVLLDEAVAAPARGPGCKLTGGTWFSYYDDTTVDGPSGLDIDHMVPLAEAWDSGASRWDAARRQAYANDLDSPRSLVAVTAKSNRSKADQDVATWLPPAADARCHYLDDWVSVKVRWNLAVDPAERDALERLAGGCPDVELDVPLA